MLKKSLGNVFEHLLYVLPGMNQGQNFGGEGVSLRIVYYHIILRLLLLLNFSACFTTFII